MSVFEKDEKVMPVLNREDILGADDIVMELVPTPEWGGDVWMKGITGKARGDWEAGIVTTTDKSTTVNMRNIRAKLCSISMCDKEGKLLFSPSDIKDLGEKSAAPLQRCYEVATRISGISDDDVDELAEGLEDNPFEGSASD